MNIELEKINFSYNTTDNTPAVTDISFRITQGELVGIIGRTGSGKTTVLELCAGLLIPDSGIISMDSTALLNAKDWNAVRSKIGIVFQFPEKQIFEETVIDDVSFGISQNGHANSGLPEWARASLDMVGLDPHEFENRSPHSLSSGERRKVAIAGVLAMRPDVVLLDEPTIGLDFNSAHDIEKIIKDLHENGKTVCVVSHNLDFIVRIARRIIVIDDGAIKFDGEKEALFSDGDMLQTCGIDRPDITQLCDTLRSTLPALNSYVYDVQGLIRLVKNDQ